MAGRIVTSAVKCAVIATSAVKCAAEKKIKTLPKKRRKDEGRAVLREAGAPNQLLACANENEILNSQLARHLCRRAIENERFSLVSSIPE